MSERPILMSAPMVRAILEGRKSQTRRIIALPRWAEPCNEDHEFELDGDPPWPHAIGKVSGCLGPIECPYGQPGEQLWVRETWRPMGVFDAYELRELGSMFHNAGTALNEHIAYRADCDDGVSVWRSPIFMPRWASRLTLRITKVRVERLQDISEQDAVAEGCKEFVSRWWQGLVRLPDGGRSMSEGGADPDGPPPAEYEHPEIQEYRRPARHEFSGLWSSINGKGSWDANPWVWVIEFERIEQQARAA